MICGGFPSAINGTDCKKGVRFTAVPLHSPGGAGVGILLQDREPAGMPAPERPMDGLAASPEARYRTPLAG